MNPVAAGLKNLLRFQFKFQQKHQDTSSLLARERREKLFGNLAYRYVQTVCKLKIDP